MSSPAPEISHRQVLRIAVPMMFAYLSTALVGTVSTAAIGRLGIADLAAGIAIAAILFDVLFVSLNFLRSTTLGLTAIALGAGREGEATAILQRAMALSLGLGLVILLLRGPEARIGLRLLGAQGAVLRAAMDYTLIRALSAPFALGNYTILGTLLGRGRANAGLVLQLILNGTNILVCVLAVLVLHQGVQGAAFAALAGEAAAFLAGLFWLRRSGPLLAGIGRALRDAPSWRAMAILNRDTLIRTLALLFAFAFFTREGAMLGAVILAANAIHMQFFALASNCLDGFAAAAEQLAGRMTGAGNRAGFSRTVRLTLAWSLCAGAAIAIAYAVFGHGFIALLSTVPLVRRQAASSLILAALVPVIAAPAFQLDGVFIGATWSRDMRNMMLISLALFLTAWAALRPAGNTGLWLAFLIFLAARGVTLGLALRSRYGALDAALLDSPPAA